MESCEPMNTDDNRNDTVLDFEEWRALYRASLFGEYSLECERRDLFSGAVRARCVSGLKAVDVGCNDHRFERTLRDTRRDDLDQYLLVFPTSGRATLIQDQRTTTVTMGDCALIDVAKPFAYTVSERKFSCIALHVPRRTLISSIGLEPAGGMCWQSDVPAARLLSRLVLDDALDDDGLGGPAERYMQLAICDLLGALMASSDLPPLSSHNEKMFKRVTDIAKRHFSDREIGPGDLATEAGISLRYLQKLFTARGTTCGRFIQSLRLDHAIRLLHLRSQTISPQPLTEIAYACGFQDYSHFSKVFRNRFGHSPSRLCPSSKALAAGPLSPHINSE